jgi:hypothetical protein
MKARPESLSRPLSSGVGRGGFYFIVVIIVMVAVVAWTDLRNC